MSKLMEFSDGVFCPGGSLFSKPQEPSLFLSLGSQVDVYFPARKRTRVDAPFAFKKSNSRKQQQLPSIEVLPDECLFEIFRRLPTAQDNSSCVCVSKRWLMLLSNIRRDEVCKKNITQTSSPSSKSSGCDEKVGLAVSGSEELEDSDGYLSRSLEGKKATDNRLASIAVGTASRGGLGKLSIRGSNPTRQVTNLGLKAIACGCPSLRSLSLWKVSSIGDEGMFEIASGCHQLEKLDLCQCPAITDKALVAVAKNCPNLTDLTIESCSSIGNEGLLAVSQHCPKLRSVTIKSCPLVGDQGIAALLSSAHALAKLKLHALSITDMSLAVVGHYGMAVTDLFLSGLQHVSERGFWVMGNGQGLQKVKILTVTSCSGVTDVGVEALGKGCPNLKHFCLCKSAFLSDNGLASFVKSAGTLEVLQLEECHRITQFGVLGTLVNSCIKLKTLALTNCLGIRNVASELPPVPSCKSLLSLSVRGCPEFGDATLSVLGKMCPHLQSLELTGLHGITDAGLLPLIETCESGLLNVNLSGCVNISDAAVSSLVKLHGSTLDVLNLDGCRKVTDSTLMEIAGNCVLLSELDVSQCAITDSGIAALASAKELCIQILSVSGCSYLTNGSLFYLRILGHFLTGLNLQHCNGIGSSKISALMEQLWRCDILT